MKSKLATSPKPSTQPAILRPIASGTLAERMRQISAAIARRAYELFEARRSEHGHDWEDWFRAESELLIPLQAKIANIDESIMVRAEVPGFTGKDVEVRAEPRRLISHTKKQEASEHENGRAFLQENFCVLDLPHEIDPDNITATFKNEVLEVSLRKVNRGKKAPAGTKVA
jgi:HSP20 family protein